MLALHLAMSIRKLYTLARECVCGLGMFYVCFNCLFCCLYVSACGFCCILIVLFEVDFVFACFCIMCMFVSC